jgi:integrase
MKLTDANVAKLTLPEGKTETFAWDDDVTGLAVRLRSGGAKPTWVFQYRSGYRSRRMTLGAVSAISASAARATATQLYAQAKAGGDPASERAKGKAAQGETFGAALDVYLKRQAERLRPRSLIEVRRHLLVHAKPLHRLPLAEVDRRAISKLISVLADSSGPTAANRTGSSIAAMFGFMIREGWVDTNPAATLNKRTEIPRSRTLTDDELRTVWKATGGTDQYGAIVRLLMLTGCRREEIGGLAWSEIDFDKATITLPLSRTKTKREHIVPLSAMALEVLDAQPRRDREHVFGDGPMRGYRGWSQGKATLDASTAVSPEWVLHDLRRTVSLRMNGELGVQPHVVEAVLGHHQGGVASIYNRASYLREMTQALALWAERLASIVEKREAKVVPLRA